MPEGRGPSWVPGLLCDPGHMVSPLWVCSPLCEMRGQEELISEVPSNSNILIFYEIHVNVAAALNKTSTRKREHQKVGDIRVVLPLMPRYVLTFAQLRSLPGRW